MKKYKELPSNDSSDDYKFNYLYHTYKKFVFKVCKRHIKMHRDEDAEDLTQDTFIKIYKNIHKFDFTHKYLKNYIMRTAMFTAMQHPNYAGNKIYYDIDDDNINIDAMLVDDDGDINKFIDILMMKANINSDIDTLTKTDISESIENEKIFIQKLQNLLTPDEFLILDLLHFQFYQHKELSEITGIKRNQINQLIMQYKNKIKKNIDIFL